MKKSLIFAALSLMILAPMLSGCAKHSHRKGVDWYSQVPAAEHQRRFPHGHAQIPGPNGEDCVYNKNTNTYFCQFDWAE